MIEWNLDRKEVTMDSNIKPDWDRDFAYCVDDAIAKFTWWVSNRGAIAAYANVTMRERALMSLQQRMDILREHTPTVAPVKDDATAQVVRWCDENPYSEITTRSLSEAIGCTQSVARRAVHALPHYFKRINQYKYEVRNYREERAHDKALPQQS